MYICVYHCGVCRTTCLNFGLDFSQLALSCGQICVCPRQRPSLGFHVAEHAVEHHNVDGPRAEPRGSKGLRADEVGIKLWVVEVGLDGLEVAVANVLLVKADEGLQKLIHLVRGGEG